MSTSSSASTDDKLLTLPFYFMVDASISMVHSGALAAANRILPVVIDGLMTSPMLSDVVRIGMLDFSDDSRVVLRLCDARTINPIPQIVERGATSYAAAFRALRKEIEADMQQLRSDGYKIYRPAVFFITDGAPTDSQADLQSSFAELTDPTFKFRPNIIPFGVDGSTKEMLDPWVYPPAGDKRPMRSYVTGPDVDPAVAITQLAEVLLGSIMASASSVDTAGTGGGFIPPDDDDLDSMWN